MAHYGIRTTYFGLNCGSCRLRILSAQEYSCHPRKKQERTQGIRARIELRAHRSLVRLPDYLLPGPYHQQLDRLKTSALSPKPTFVQEQRN